MIPQLTAGLKAMLVNPAVCNLFNNASMSQNPAIIGAIGQLLSGMQGGAGAGMTGEQPSAAGTGANQPQNPENPPSNTDQKQPPSD